MKVNGEAIYGTRAIAPYKEGKVCITKKGDNTLYIYYMAGEGEAMPAQIGMSSFTLPAGARVKMLGTDNSLKWEKKGNGFLINIPEKIRKSPPSDYVCVMKVSF